MATEDFFTGARTDAEKELGRWISPESLAEHETRAFQGFEIVNSIDGGKVPGREVSLVRLTPEGKYPQHVHRDSDAFFVIVKGEAYLLSGDERRKLLAGQSVEVPRGMPHGFELGQEGVEFVSFQYPPIRDGATGEEDFHLVDMV